MTAIELRYRGPTSDKIQGRFTLVVVSAARWRGAIAFKLRHDPVCNHCSVLLAWLSIVIIAEHITVRAEKSRIFAFFAISSPHKAKIAFEIESIEF